MAERAIRVVGMMLLAGYIAGVAVVFRKPDGRVVFGDATHHFVQLRSLVFDRDLHFQNEYVRIYGLKGGERDTEWIFTDLTATGHVRNYMPVGPALLWAPLYLAVTAVLSVLAWLGLTAPPDGFEPVLQLVPGVTGILAVTAGALASFRMIRRYTDAAIAAGAVLAVWLGSHALYYSLVSPAYSHAASMFTAAVFFARWTATRKQPALARFAEWGCLAGLAALMRWQDAVLLAVPLVEALRWDAPWTKRVTGLAAAGGAFLLTFVPQMIVWTVLYGQPLAMPQGEDFMRWTSPGLVAVLLSDNHGLFTWAPVLLVAVAGLVSFARQHRELALPIAVILVAVWYTNAAVADWWAGEAFGARRFLSLVPLFALGLAWWLTPSSARGAAGVRQRWYFGWKPALVLLFIAANGLLLLQYQLFMKGYDQIAPYPDGWPDMWVTRLLVPIRLLQSWLG